MEVKNWLKTVGTGEKLDVISWFKKGEYVLHIL
jgi:hypothetical protein